MFAARCVVPLHAEPGTRRAGDLADEADSAERPAVGDALADVRCVVGHGAAEGVRDARGIAMLGDGCG